MSGQDGAARTQEEYWGCVEGNGDVDEVDNCMLGYGCRHLHQPGTHGGVAGEKAGHGGCLEGGSQGALVMVWSSVRSWSFLTSALRGYLRAQSRMRVQGC